MWQTLETAISLISTGFQAKSNFFFPSPNFIESQSPPSRDTLICRKCSISNRDGEGKKKTKQRTTQHSVRTLPDVVLRVQWSPTEFLMNIFPFSPMIQFRSAVPLRPTSKNLSAGGLLLIYSFFFGFFSDRFCALIAATTEKKKEKNP